MKKMRKNNKGFSLVELIVVVLIMAIIAIALAPQIMKWVGHSRTSTDAQTYDTLVENVQLALADADSLASVTDAAATGNILITITETSTTVTYDDAAKTAVASTNAFYKKLEEICGTGWTGKIKKKDAAAANYEITVAKADGSVTRTKAPEADDVK